MRGQGVLLQPPTLPKGKGGSIHPFMHSFGEKLSLPDLGSMLGTLACGDR